MHLSNRRQKFAIQHRKEQQRFSPIKLQLSSDFQASETYFKIKISSNNTFSNSKYLVIKVFPAIIIVPRD
jgi:hypothetical protein